MARKQIKSRAQQVPIYIQKYKHPDPPLSVRLQWSPLVKYTDTPCVVLQRQSVRIKVEFFEVFLARVFELLIANRECPQSKTRQVLVLVGMSTGNENETKFDAPDGPPKEIPEIPEITKPTETLYEFLKTFEENKKKNPEKEASDPSQQNEPRNKKEANKTNSTFTFKKERSAECRDNLQNIILTFGVAALASTTYYGHFFPPSIYGLKPFIFLLIILLGLLLYFGYLFFRALFISQEWNFNFQTQTLKEITRWNLPILPQIRFYSLDKLYSSSIKIDSWGCTDLSTITLNWDSPMGDKHRNACTCIIGPIDLRGAYLFRGKLLELTERNYKELQFPMSPPQDASLKEIHDFLQLTWMEETICPMLHALYWFYDSATSSYYYDPSYDPPYGKSLSWHVYFDSTNPRWMIEACYITLKDVRELRKKFPKVYFDNQTQ